mgnify:FL=1
MNINKFFKKTKPIIDNKIKEVKNFIELKYYLDDFERYGMSSSINWWKILLIKNPDLINYILKYHNFLQSIKQVSDWLIIFRDQRILFYCEAAGMFKYFPKKNWEKLFSSYEINLFNNKLFFQKI